MSSIDLYSAIHDRDIKHLRAGKIKIDNNIINSQIDHRMGISLIIPILTIKDVYEKVVNDFISIDPNQYYYPFSDLHITVFDFAKGSSSYVFNAFREQQLMQICDELFKDMNLFEINFRGIIFSIEAGMIKGYDSDILTSIRNKIRSALQRNNIPLDERYKSESAHVTFCRFKNTIAKIDPFIELIENMKEYDFGNQFIDNIELVEHDWYNMANKKRIIKTYKLKHKSLHF
jgi:2'-5' RNA ligase